MLKTPLGKVEIQLDNVSIPYKFYRIENDYRCPDLEGRYLIPLKIEPDGKPHSVSCVIEGCKPDSRNGCETGERLECLGLYADHYKLSVATLGEDLWESDLADYDCIYLDNGICINMFPFTMTKYYVFGLAWISNLELPVAENVNDRDLQTWFGAECWVQVPWQDWE